MAKLVEVLVFDYEKRDYVPVRIPDIRKLDNAMVIGGPFKITVDGEEVYALEASR